MFLTNGTQRVTLITVLVSVTGHVVLASLSYLSRITSSRASTSMDVFFHERVTHTFISETVPFVMLPGLL